MVGGSWTRVFLALLLLLAVSCSRQTSLATQPERSNAIAAAGAELARSQPDRAPGDFYPLAIGNQWTYVSEFSGETRTLDDSLVSSGTEIDEIRRSIDCEGPYDGVPWLVQTDRYRTRGQQVDRIDWIRMRQDRDGLYELEVVPTDAYPCGPLATGSTRLERTEVDARFVSGIRDPRFRAATERALRAVAARNPFARSAGSAIGVTTLVRLKYPLRVGAHWSIRPQGGGEPLFVATVEAHEVLSLPAGRYPGYRIRIQSDLFGPEDSVLFWYGRAGWLAMQTHVLYAITDENGVVIGKGKADQRIQLTGIGEPARQASRIEERE